MTTFQNSAETIQPRQGDQAAVQRKFPETAVRQQNYPEVRRSNMTQEIPFYYPEARRHFQFKQLMFPDNIFSSHCQEELGDWA